MRLRIAENFEALFYAPLYALQSLGFAQQEGLAIEWLPAGAPGGAIDAVRAGEVDLTWGGPMRVLRDRDTQPDDAESLVCFGEVVGRDPFMLLMRPADAAACGSALTLSQLTALRLSVVSEVPTPWQCLQQDLRDADLDPDQISAAGRLVQGLSMEGQIDALRNGQVDVIQLFEPQASGLEHKGWATVVRAASDRGPCCYTSFITSRASFGRHRLAFAALQRALERTQRWMAEAGAADIAREIERRFGGWVPDVLQHSVARYLGAGVWSSRPQISRAGIDRLRLSLLSGGFVRQAAGFDAIVMDPESID